VEAERLHPGSTAASRVPAKGAPSICGMSDTSTPRRTAERLAGHRRDLTRAPLEYVQALSLTVVTIWSLLDRAPGVPGTRGRPLVAGCCLALIVIGWCGWAGSAGRPRLRTGALTTLTAASGVLAVVSARGPSATVGAVAVVIAANRLRPQTSLAVLAVGMLGTVVTAVVIAAPAGVWAGALVTFGGCWVLGGVRRSYRLRAEEAEHALAQERRAIAAEKHAAALEERNRIAREIHDILAHSLSALSVNLSAAEGLLSGDESATEANRAKARQCVRLAGGLAREGMAETRRAVLALREDPRPLPEMLAGLVDTHGGEGRVGLEVCGSAEGRPSPEAGLVAFRTAQEALTNVRKHAPGAEVTIRLEYEPEAMTLTVRSTLPPAGTHRPLAGEGSGHGLTGLAERAVLAGGTLDAGPDHDAWRVRLRIPG
jgi:signal transduction histidine kinase